MSCPSWCRFQDVPHAHCTSAPLWPTESFFAFLIHLNEWNGNNYTPEPYVEVTSRASDGGYITAKIGTESDQLAQFLESLGHKELGTAVRKLNRMAAES